MRTKAAITTIMVLGYLTSGASAALFTYAIDGEPGASIVLEDGFEDGTLDSSKWTTWDAYASSATIDESGGSVTSTVVAADDGVGHAEGQIASQQAFNPFEKKTEFTFHQYIDDSSDLGYHNFNSNYITTSKSGIGSTGFRIQWKKQNGKTNLQYRTAGGSWSSLTGIFSTFSNISFVHHMAYSLVLGDEDDDNQLEYELYAHYDGLKVGNYLRDSGVVSGITPTDIDSGLYHGFGTGGHSDTGTFSTSTYEAGVVQVPEPVTLLLFAVGGLLPQFRRRK